MHAEDAQVAGASHHDAYVSRPFRTPFHALQHCVVPQHARRLVGVQCFDSLGSLLHLESPAA